MTGKSPIQNAIDPGERLLWEGRPRQGVVFRKYDLYFVPFSVIWLAFAVYWESLAVQPLLQHFDQEPHLVAYIFPAFGLVFVAIGLQMVFGRHYSDSNRRKKTHYGVTNDRALMLVGSRPKSIRSHALTPYTEIELTLNTKGIGTITFGRRSLPNWFMPYFVFSSFQDDTEFAFVEIRDAKQVYDIIRDIQRQQD